jgi:ribosomal protein L11
MNKGLVKDIYSIKSGFIKKPEVKGTVKMWLRAGHALFSRNEITRKLSPWDIDIDYFISRFDVASKHISGAPVPVTVRIYDDKSFDFEFGRISRTNPPLIPEAIDPYQIS